MWRTTLGALFWGEHSRLRAPALHRFPLGNVCGWNTLQLVSGLLQLAVRYNLQWSGLCWLQVAAMLF